MGTVDGVMGTEEGRVVRSGWRDREQGTDKLMV